MTAFDEGCDWIGPCSHCGSIFACEMIKRSKNNEGIHIHMVMAGKGTFHSAVSDAESSEKP